MADKLHLASHSPRRRELIALLGVPFESIEPPDIDEDRFLKDFKGQLVELPAALAEAKAKLVFPQVNDGYLVCADTVVVLDNSGLGKPVDSQDAERMLRLLSGVWHEVITGISICHSPSNNILTGAERTSVKFATLTDDEIRRYVATGEPYDKAGAYGIQGMAAPFIERIEGCYHNVVGLPLNLLYRMLRDMGFRF